MAEMKIKVSVPFLIERVKVAKKDAEKKHDVARAQWQKSEETLPARQAKWDEAFIAMLDDPTVRVTKRYDGLELHLTRRWKLGDRPCKTEAPVLDLTFLDRKLTILSGCVTDSLSISEDDHTWRSIL